LNFALPDADKSASIDPVFQENFHRMTTRLLPACNFAPETPKRESVFQKPGVCFIIPIPKPAIAQPAA
jgi:hypothetical protein